MTSFRILDQDPVYRDLNDVIAAGGHLRFYESETTTPKDVYGDEALTINNGPEVLIGADGRATVDIWGDGTGPYRVRLYDADENLITERDDVDLPDAGLSIPALASGEFLTNNGSVLQWDAISQVPDMTGQSGKVLGNNGTTAIWQALAETDANAVLTFVTGGVKLSDGTNARVFVSGTGTVAASGTAVAAETINYGVTFTSAPAVFAEINGSAGVANPGGGIPSHGITSVGTTSCQIAIDTNAFGSTVNIVNPVPFFWWAVGPVAV